MYDYSRRRKIGPVTILFLFLFSASIVGLLIIAYLDRGRFWDMLPYFCIPIIVLSLIFTIYNLVRRCNAGFIFILFFIVFTIGLVLSSIFGPFSLRREAESAMEEKNYTKAITDFNTILEDYSSSRYADDALYGISFAYYYDGRFQESLQSFRDAMERGLIDPNNLEVLDIRQDIYFNTALGYEEDGEYLKAAESYQESIRVLKIIKSDFPDTNEAFIARYKIPLYLFEASKDLAKYGDNLSRIQLLEEILKDHTESDQYSQALEVIGDAYMDMAVELASESDYDSAMEWFSKLLGSRPEQVPLNFQDYRINRIFSGAPPAVIKKYADRAYREGAYESAFFLYDILLEYNPGYLENVLDYTVESRLSIAGNPADYEPLEPIPGKYINLPGLCQLVIINDSRDQLKAYIKGDKNYLVTIPAGETVETEMTPGEYMILIEHQDRDLAFFLGNMKMEEYRKYTQVFEEITEDGDS